MRSVKRLLVVFLMFLSIGTLTTNPFPNRLPCVQAAVKIKINYERLELEVGKSKTLRIFGTKSKVLWNSEDVTVATVSKNGRVTAVGEGETVITARIGKKKLGCLITVTKPESKYVKNAPFQAVEKSLDQLCFVIPKDWSYQVNTIEGIYYAVVEQEGLISNITIIARPSNVGTKDFKEVKDSLSEMTSRADSQKKVLLPGEEDSSIKLSVYDASFGKVLVLSQDAATLEGKACYLTTYVFTFGDYEIHIKARDGYDCADILTYAEYLINSMNVR